MKRIVFYLTIITLFAGCQQRQEAPLSLSEEEVQNARHEWNWARQVCDSLGDEVRPDRLSQFESVPLARLMMLNAYQNLANQYDGMLDEDWFVTDYALWEAVFREYEDHYTNIGSSRNMMLTAAYEAITKLRLDILQEEIGYLSWDHDGATQWFVSADEIKWDTDVHALRAWFNHRMEMANALQPINQNRAEYLRHITYKTVFIFSHLQLDWTYDFERI